MANWLFTGDASRRGVRSIWFRDARGASSDPSRQRNSDFDQPSRVGLLVPRHRRGGGMRHQRQEPSSPHRHFSCPVRYLARFCSRRAGRTDGARKSRDLAKDRLSGSAGDPSIGGRKSSAADLCWAGRLAIPRDVFHGAVSLPDAHYRNISRDDPNLGDLLVGGPDIRRRDNRPHSARGAPSPVADRHRRTAGQSEGISTHQRRETDNCGLVYHRSSGFAMALQRCEPRASTAH